MRSHLGGGGASGSEPDESFQINYRDDGELTFDEERVIIGSYVLLIIPRVIRNLRIMARMTRTTLDPMMRGIIPPFMECLIQRKLNMLQK